MDAQRTDGGVVRGDRRRRERRRNLVLAEQRRPMVRAARGCERAAKSGRAASLLESGPLSAASRAAAALLQGGPESASVVGRYEDFRRWRFDVVCPPPPAERDPRTGEEQAGAAAQRRAALRIQHRARWLEGAHGDDPRPRQDLEGDESPERSE